MNPLHLAQTRHASKAYDNTKKISSDTLDRLLEVLRLAPSSINIQPWTFIVAQSDEAKQNIGKAMKPNKTLPKRCLSHSPTTYQKS